MHPAPDRVPVAGSPVVDTGSDAEDHVRLSAIFRPDCIVVFGHGLTKGAVIEALLTSMANAALLPRGEIVPLTDAILTRERVGTTAIGKGFALPNLRTKQVSRVVGAVGLIPDGVDFDSLDDAPTTFVFLVLAPFEERERHMEVMGRLCALAKDKTTQFFLRAVPLPQRLHEFFVDMDARLTGEQTDSSSGGHRRWRVDSHLRQPRTALP